MRQARGLLVGVVLLAVALAWTWPGAAVQQPGRVTVELNGPGSADLGDLDARDAIVRVGGSGDADVRAAQRLRVDVDGSGDVRYHGQPELSQQVHGSGDVSQAS